MRLPIHQTSGRHDGLGSLGSLFQPNVDKITRKAADGGLIAGFLSKLGLESGTDRGELVLSNYWILLFMVRYLLLKMLRYKPAGE